jgi:hypothetical protein
VIIEYKLQMDRAGAIPPDIVFTYRETRYKIYLQARNTIHSEQSSLRETLTEHDLIISSLVTDQVTMAKRRRPSAAPQ